MATSQNGSRHFNSIHRQQLFYWTGRNLDATASNKTAAQRLSQRMAYVGRLKSIIKNGIWLKTPDKPDQLGDGALIKVTRPIACFTEWSVAQSRPHTTEYGRLGFGFSKSYVLSHGGQPVIYARDAKSNARYVTALLAIAKILKDDSIKIPSSCRESLWSHFDFISHFVKAIQKPAPKKAMPSRKPSKLPNYQYLPADKALDALLELSLSEQEKEFKRKYGRFLHYLEEREWRIVFDDSLSPKFSVGPGGNGPDYFLQFEPGKELFTVVVPDNLTVNLVMQDKELREKLFPQDGLPVTLLSLEDVGTF